MIMFDCDYLEGAHPAIIEALSKTNLEQTPGYSTDEYCEQARKIIQQECKAPNADVHFLVGGTQANTTVIASALRPYQGVVCAESGHINVHETGAVEGTGHKVIGLKSSDGKVDYCLLEQYLSGYENDHTKEHIVQPKMLYISFPTECGTLYSAGELKNLRELCDKYSIYLFVDGARLGYGLGSPENDVTMPYLAQIADVFYIGGTKVGALFGEAVVIINSELKIGFRAMIKRQGGMFAKGRLLGLQFLTLFTNGLYYNIAAKAVKQAYEIKQSFANAGFEFLFESYTNQQFPVLPDTVLELMNDKFSFDYWCRVDDTHSCVRFCTSWATTDENVKELTDFIQDFKRTVK